VKIRARDVARPTTDNLIHIAGGQLPLPGGIAQGPGGAIFVTVNTANPAPGSGMVVKVAG